MEGNKAAAVTKAWDALRGTPPEERYQVRDAIRTYIAGLPTEAVDAAIIELFEEVQICDEVFNEALR
jgi:hypothetical protein